MNIESVRAEFESKLQEKFLTGDNQPAITIYNHLDVQPANEPQWRRAPFVFGYHAQFVRIFYDRVVPGIYSEFDDPAMLPLIAPRPLMVINGDSDSLTPLPAVMLAANRASEAYGKAGAKEKFVLRVQKNTAHSVNGDSLRAAIDWFVSWLKPSS